MEQAIISADSHVIEVPDLWEKGLPSSMRDRAPKAYFDEGRDAWMFGSDDVIPQAVGGLFMAGQRPEQVEEFRRAGFSVARPGGWDPVERIKDMATDGVSGEVLYPSLGLGFFCVEDAAFQEGLFRTYNDWLIEYCQGAPDRLFGIALISAFDMDHAVAEMERCRKAGMLGTLIWQVPHADLPFTSDHYERYWAASQDLDMPVHLHILTGFGDSMHRQTAQGMKRYRIGVEQTREIEDALFDIMFSGVLERYPKLKIVSVENEIGWIPFWLGAVRQELPAPSPRPSPCPWTSRPASTSPGRSTPPSSTTISAADCSRGGARGQLHVVQRLPAPELDLAAFPGRHRAGSGPTRRRRPRQAAEHQRREALQFERVAADERGPEWQGELPEQGSAASGTDHPAKQASTKRRK